MHVEMIRTASRTYTVQVTGETATHLSYVPVRIVAGKHQTVPVFMPGEIAKADVIERAAA